jgi:AcrR family transcriptional regulator
VVSPVKKVLDIKRALVLLYLCVDLRRLRLSPRVSQDYLGRRREEILQAAITCCARTGFKRTTMRDICRQARLSTGAVYNYFKGKEEILEALTLKGRETKRSTLEGLKSERSAREALRELFKCVFAAYKNEGFRIYGPIDVETYNEALRNERVRQIFLDELESLVKPISEIIAYWQGREQIRRDIDPLYLANCLIALTVGIKIHLLIQPDLCIEKFEDTIEKTISEALTV